jgi:amino-acid N-acetyltransferase
LATLKREPSTLAIVSPILTRKATAADLDAVLQLAARGDLLATGIVESFAGFFVAASDGLIVGSCGLEKHSRDGLLRTVVVASELRGRGVGKQLVEIAMTHAREQGLRAVYLLTTTGREFFAARGFEVVTRESAPAGIRDSWEFAAGCPETAVFMRRGT